MTRVQRGAWFGRGEERRRVSGGVGGGELARKMERLNIRAGCTSKLGGERAAVVWCHRTASRGIDQASDAMSSRLIRLIAIAIKRVEPSSQLILPAFALFSFKASLLGSFFGPSPNPFYPFLPGRMQSDREFDELRLRATEPILIYRLEQRPINGWVDIRWRLNNNGPPWRRLELGKHIYELIYTNTSRQSEGRNNKAAVGCFRFRCLVFFWV